MTPYETVFIVHPERGGRLKEFIDRFKGVIEGLGGTVSLVDEWGLRDLAYRIHKQTKGYYVLFQYRSEARAVEELERNMKLTDGVMRYLTVRLDEAALMAQAKKKEVPEEARTEVREESAKSGV